MQINMKERSFISESLIYDFIHANMNVIEDYKFPEDKKCKAYLEAEKKKGNTESVGTKCKLIEEEIVNVKRQKVEITQSTVKSRESRDKMY